MAAKPIRRAGLASAHIARIKREARSMRDVSADTAVDHIASRSAVDRVIAIASADGVIALTGENQVSASARLDRVIASEPTMKSEVLVPTSLFAFRLPKMMAIVGSFDRRSGIAPVEKNRRQHFFSACRLRQNHADGKSGAKSSVPFRDAGGPTSK